MFFFRLIRPALYSAVHPILPVFCNSSIEDSIETNGKIETMTADIVGPVCETACFLSKDIAISQEISRNDFIATLHCGAYASVMSSNYNSRPKIKELLLIDDEKNEAKEIQIIRQEEEMIDLYGNELQCLQSPLKSKL